MPAPPSVPPPPGGQAPPPGARRGTPRKDAALLLASTVLSLALAALFLRWYRPEVLWAVTGTGPTAEVRFRIPHGTYHHALLPNARVKTLNKETRRDVVDFETNSLGLRDPERAIPKPSGTFRILMLGDSFLEGSSLPREETVCAVLEGMLTERRGAPVEVVNAGLSSYSPLPEYLFYKNDGARLAPDLVVLCLDMSDVQDDYFYECQAEFGRDGLPVRIPPAWDREEWRRRRPETRGDILTDRYAHTREGATLTAAVSERFDRTYSYVRLTEELARKRGAAFLLAVYPMGHQVSSSEWVEGRKRMGFGPGVHRGPLFDYLEARSRKDGMEYLDLLPGFRASREHPLYLDHDGHWTPAGHRVAAGLLAQHLLSRRLVPPPARGAARPAP